MVESKLSNAVIAKDAIVREVKELTMEYEETVEVKDGYCKALLAITDRYERKREEVVGKIARTESGGSNASSLNSFY